MREPLWILTALSLAAMSSASAEIFKCVEKSGIERYQNFPCPLDSLGSMPTAPQGANAGKSPTAQRTATPPASAPGPGKSLSRAASPPLAQLRVGMASDEVRALWGEPEETWYDEKKEGRIEVWNYANGRSVHFSRKQRVVAFEP